MTQEFYALPVNQGDSFLLHRDDKYILVDGGGNKGHLVKLLTAVGSPKLDIVVCTHGDKDHVNGLNGLFNKPSFLHENKDNGNSTEFWIPVLWQHILDRCQSDKQIWAAIKKELDSIAKHGPLSETVWISIDKEIALITLEEPPTGVYTNSFRLKISLKGHARGASFVHPDNAYIHLRYGQSDLDAFIGTLKAIRTLRNEAAKHGKLIYFQYIPTEWAAGGCTSILEPMNSVEVQHVNANVSPLILMALTMANIFSLVFHSPSTPGCGGVLFSADSPLSFLTIPPHSPVNGSYIVTTPHHGSEDNKDGCERVLDWHQNPSEIFWVRSDKRKIVSRPWEGYTNLPGTRFCTICNPPCNQQKQQIELLDRGGAWRVRSGRKCHH